MDSTCQRRGGVLIHTVHIDDMLAVIECLACVRNLPVNGVQRQSVTNHIILCDEDHKGFRQVAEIIAWLEQMRVQDAGMVSCPFPVRSFIRPLYLDVVFLACIIIRVNVQTDIPAEQVLHSSLRLHTLHTDVRLVQDDPEQKLGTVCVTVKAGVHEVIIDQAQSPETLQVFLVLFLFSASVMGEFTEKEAFPARISSSFA